MAEPKTRRVLVVGAVVVVLGGAAAGAWAATRPSGVAYRLATAGPGPVTESIDTTGTIQPVSRATVTFPASGQVASVDVSVGQRVTVGQRLATLNTTSLRNAVSAQQSAVASAQAKLAAAQGSQASVTAAAQSTSPSSAGSASTDLGRRLAGAQQAVRRAQQRVDADLALVAAADHKVTVRGAACQSLLDQLRTAPPSATPSTTATPPPASVDDCTELIDQVLADESRTGTDERALSAAVARLTTELTKAVAAAAASQSGPTPGSGTGGSGGSGQPVSAARIAADQAAVDAARAQLAAARQSLAAATLTSPITGTVADVTVTEGQQATAGSTDAAIVVVGDGQDEVTTAVTDSQVGQVEPGDHATVSPDGATTPIQGTVTRIGALGTTTSSGAASYPVTISLAGTGQRLFAGATASVAITLRTAKAAVTVPTSAVREFGGFAVVSKLVAGKATSTRVTIGARGPELTQVTSGLRAGDRVVLADLDQPLPTSDDTLNRPRLARGFAARPSGR